MLPPICYLARALKGVDVFRAGNNLFDRKGDIRDDRDLMANREYRYPENVLGKYYVDDQCIDCDLCRETAPTLFTRNEAGCYSYVSKQPETEEEGELMIAAMEGCPVEAVGDDGEGELSPA